MSSEPFGAMSGLRVCGCLNWSIHCQEVQPCDRRHLAPADPFFKDGLVCAKLAPQGIAKKHSFLESVRTVGEWEVHSCQGCQRDVYAQSSDRSLLLSANLEKEVHSNLIIMKSMGDTELPHYSHYFVITVIALNLYLPFGCKNFDTQIRRLCCGSW